MAQVNLLQLYNQTFGYVGTPYTKAEYKAVVPSFGDSEELETYEIQSLQESVLGTPIFLPCRLDDILLPNEPLMRISGSKKVIETEFDGQEGTFKEIYSLSDYNIEITGFAINEDEDAYPEDIMRQIRGLCEKRGSSRAVNDICTLFNITHLTIYDWDFPAVAGEISMQGYRLSCKSDRVFELEVKKQV